MSKEKRDGFAFEGRGVVETTETYTTKSGNDIVTLVVKVEGPNRTELIPVKFFGRLGDKALSLKKGTRVDITGHLGGRDWNGKVYGDNVAETVEVVTEAKKPEQAQQESPPPPDDSDVPF